MSAFYGKILPVTKKTARVWGDRLCHPVNHRDDLDAECNPKGVFLGVRDYR
jgi:hypothetical protein